MTHASTPELLALHAVRVMGVATDDAVARRFALDPAVTKELLLDYQAFGWITWSEFAGRGGWSLLERGREENERRLAAELDLVDGATALREVYRAFLPLNERLQIACTHWQLRPTDDDPHAFNDHSDPTWDGRVIRELSALADELSPLSSTLCALLDRFQSYHPRFTAALDHVTAGDEAWVDRTDVDSCHKVWFELHEDLIATLGLTRGIEP
jgi:hypothetical protein